MYHERRPAHGERAGARGDLGGRILSGRAGGDDPGGGLSPVDCLVFPTLPHTPSHVFPAHSMRRVEVIFSEESASIFSALYVLDNILLYDGDLFYFCYTTGICFTVGNA